MKLLNFTSMDSFQMCPHYLTNCSKGFVVKGRGSIHPLFESTFLYV